jgi:hypothetical protein
MMSFFGRLLEGSFHANYVQLPKVVTHNFKSAYDGIPVAQCEDDFQRWCLELGYQWLMRNAITMKRDICHNGADGRSDFLIKHL